MNFKREYRCMNKKCVVIAARQEDNTNTESRGDKGESQLPRFHRHLVEVHLSIHRLGPNSDVLLLLFRRYRHFPVPRRKAASSKHSANQCNRRVQSLITICGPGERGARGHAMVESTHFASRRFEGSRGRRLSYSK